MPTVTYYCLQLSLIIICTTAIAQDFKVKCITYLFIAIL